MGNEFSISDKLTIGIIFVNSYAISIFPGSVFLSRYNYAIQIFVFVLLILINLNYNIFSTYTFPKLNFFLLMGIVSGFFFLISSFYINIEYNLSFNAIGKLISYPVIIFIFFFYFPKLLFTKQEIFEKFVNIWILFVLANCVIAIVFIALGISPNQKFSGIAVSVFSHPNAFSFVLMLSIPMLLYKFLFGKINFFIFCIAMLLLLGTLLFTFSRAGYIGAFVSILILTYKKSPKAFLLSLFILVVIIFTFFLDFAFAKTGASSISRFQIMVVALNMIFNSGINRLLWGYGILNNIKVFQTNNSLMGITRDEVDPHNVLLLLGIQFGILLTLFVSISVLYLIAKVLLAENKSVIKRNNGRVYLSLSIVVGLIFQNLFEDIIVYPEYFLMPIFLIFLGYLYQYVYNRNSKI